MTGTLATDLALTITHRLREVGVTGEFVEFFGPGVSTLTVGERAVVANMAPEYGATTGYFPIDANVLDYLAGTGRTAEQTRLVEAYAKQAGLWFDPRGNPRLHQGDRRRSLRRCHARCRPATSAGSPALRRDPQRPRTGGRPGPRRRRPKCRTSPWPSPRSPAAPIPPTRAC